MLNMRTMVIPLWVIAIISSSLCDTKIWRYNTDVTDQDNWEKEGEDEDCEGLIFPATVSFAALPKLEVKQIAFPQDGEFAFTDDSEIRFDDTTQDKVNCAYLNRSMFNARYWSDGANWISRDMKNIEAVPHLERTPCQYDDVVFPRGISSSVVNMFYANYKIKSFIFGNDSWRNEDLPEYSNSKIIRQILEGYQSLMEEIIIKGKECEDPTGCICGNENALTCWSIPNYMTENDACLDNQLPVGFCHYICGAYILFKPVRKTFRIDVMRKTLEAYESITHVSKVLHNETEYIQIIFTEKEFEGVSLDEARDLYSRLLEDSSFGAQKVKLSSASRKTGSSVGMVFGIIFGIASGCLIAFLIYSPRSRRAVLASAVDLRDRLSRLNFRNRETFTTHFLARYRSGEDAELVEGSVLSLERSFENPLHDEPSPSTSSTSCDTNEGKTKPKTGFENPLYDEHKGLDVEKVMEDAELVDLTN